MRLSEDDGPPAHLFLGDDDDQEGGVDIDEEDNDGRNRRDGRPLVPSVGTQRPARLVEVTGLEDVPPVPPPKDLS